MTIEPGFALYEALASLLPVPHAGARLPRRALLSSGPLLSSTSPNHPQKLSAAPTQLLSIHPGLQSLQVGWAEVGDGAGLG